MSTSPNNNNNKHGSFDLSDTMTLVAGIFLMIDSLDNTYGLLGGLFLTLAASFRINRK